MEIFFTYRIGCRTSNAATQNQFKMSSKSTGSRWARRATAPSGETQHPPSTTSTGCDKHRDISRLGCNSGSMVPNEFPLSRHSRESRSQPLSARDLKSSSRQYGNGTCKAQGSGSSLDYLEEILRRGDEFKKPIRALKAQAKSVTRTRNPK